MARILGFFSAVCFVGSFIAFTWLRAIRYRARCILERDGAEPEPADVDADVVRAVDGDLAGQERAAWLVWALLTICFVGSAFAAMVLSR